MTEVVRYRCTNCEATFGPMGFHGWDPARRSGELPMACAACKILFVGRFLEGKLQPPGCPACHGEGEPLGPVCPVCGQASLVFGDVRMPGFERPVGGSRLAPHGDRLAISKKE